MVKPESPKQMERLEPLERLELILWYSPAGAA